MYSKCNFVYHFSLVIRMGFPSFQISKNSRSVLHDGSSLFGLFGYLIAESHMIDLHISATLGREKNPNYCRIKTVY